MTRALLPWQKVVVEGPSMTPTLRHGDVLLVRHTDRVRAGAVVLGRFVSMPARLVVKRAARRVDGGWWLVSDNPYAGGDSAAHGIAQVHGVVDLCWRRRSDGRLSLRPRRVGAVPAHVVGQDGSVA